MPRGLSVPDHHPQLGGSEHARLPPASGGRVRRRPLRLEGPRAPPGGPLLALIVPPPRRLRARPLTSAPRLHRGGSQLGGFRLQRDVRQVRRLRLDLPCGERVQIAHVAQLLLDLLQRLGVGPALLPHRTLAAPFSAGGIGHARSAAASASCGAAGGSLHDACGRETPAAGAAASKIAAPPVLAERHADTSSSAPNTLGLESGIQAGRVQSRTARCGGQEIAVARSADARRSACRVMLSFRAIFQPEVCGASPPGWPRR